MENKLNGSKLKIIKNNFGIYLMLVPAVILAIIFKYIPIGGAVIAFQDFNIFANIGGSEWVGFDHFIRLFQTDDFWRGFFNTLQISFLKLIVNTPVSIILALILNEIGSKAFKNVSQSFLCIPHFLSWVVVSGIFLDLLSPSTGAVNSILKAFGMEPISFLMDNDYFPWVLVFSELWKEIGWLSIIYTAAITGVPSELYEAASVDGAGRLRKMWSITLPSIKSTIVLMVIIKLGYIMESSFEQVLMMYNQAVYESGDILGTYVYRLGLGKMEYSFSTAAGLFNSFIGLALLLFGNYFSRKMVGKSIW